MNQTIKISGKARIKVFSKEGKLLQDTGWMKNIITNAGKAAIAGLAGNVGSVNPFTYIALGTSATAVAATDTLLTAELTDSGLQRGVADSVTRTTTTVTNDTLTLIKTFTATGTKTIQEAGILNAASTGDLLSHLLVSPTVSVINSNSIQITYKVKFA